MIYLAGPYSHKDEAIRIERFEALTKKAAQLMHVVFSPITHGHAIAERHDLPLDFAWWGSQCLEMLKNAKKLIVLRIDGYAVEIKFAETNGIPVSYVNP